MANQQKFINNASLILADFIGTTTTIIQVINTDGIPALTNGDYYIATLIPVGGIGALEIVRITAVTQNQVTVLRAQEGTTAQPFIAGSGIEIRLTAGSLSNFNQIPPNFVSIVDFGAIGDGTTDNQTFIQTALNTVSANGGGIIIVPAGNFGISGTLTLPSGVSLFGESGSPAFPELSPIAVSVIHRIGTSATPLCITVPKYVGNMKNIVWDARGIATECFGPVSIGGCNFECVRWISSTQVGVNWTSISANPSGLNTFINCSSDDHQAVGFRMSGLVDAAVTLNTFVGCRFSGSIQNLVVYQYADTNVWIGGRIEGGIQYGLVVNDPAGGLNVDSLVFYGVTMDGSGIGGSAMCFIAAPLISMPDGGGSTVATFRDCHMTSSTVFNSAPLGANIIVKDCPSFGQMYGVTGNNAPAQLITIGASPFLYNHQDPYDAQIVIQGGVLTGLIFVRGGVTQNLQTFTSGIQLVMKPGDKLVIEYTTAPGLALRYQV